jgi:hypothetical protein
MSPSLKRVAVFMRVSAMLTICIGIFAFMPFLFTAASDVYAQEAAKTSPQDDKGGVLGLLGGLSGEKPAETPSTTQPTQTKPYTFDGDVYIVDRDPKALHEVIKVVSANTILLDSGEMVRMIGVELAEEDAERAFRLVRGLLEGKEVRLEFKRRNRDIEGNLLAVVYKGDINVNEMLEAEFYLNTEIDPALYYSPGYLRTVFPNRDKPMDFWELTLGEEKPPEKKLAVVELKAKDKPRVEGELVKESKDFIIIRQMYKGLEVIQKKDVKELTFK